MEGQDRVVGLDDGIRHLRGRNDGVRAHDSVRVLLTGLGDQKCSHTGSGTTTEGVDELEALKAIASLSLLTNDIQDGVDQLSTLGVVTLGPVVTSSGLTEDKVVRSEELTERSS